MHMVGTHGHGDMYAWAHDCMGVWGWAHPVC